MSTEKIVLIDGHSILNRAFYGVPPLTNGEGVHTNAVYGFLNIMLKILDEEHPGYLAVAFDLAAPTFRHKMYDAYKGTRKPMPEELREQVPLIKEMLTAMGIPLMMLEGFEADDLLGTVSRQMEEKGLAVSVISGDRDLLQLASDTVCIRIPRTKSTGTEVDDFYAAQVKETYQVTPTEFIDVKALMGDASDNIPGVPSIGEKTAVRIIAQYGSIENAHDHVDEITPPRARESLREHYDLAVLSKKLAMIDRHCPFALDLEAAKIGDLFTPQAHELCKRLELRSLLGRFKADEPAQAPEDFRTVRGAEAVRREMEAFLGGMGEDREKRIGLAAALQGDKLLGAALSADPDSAVFFSCMDDGETSPGEQEESAAVIQEYLGRIAAKAGLVCTIGLKEQLPRIGDGNIPLEESGRFFDAEIAAYLLNPLKNGYPYDEIIKDHTGKLCPSAEELFGKKKDAMPPEQRAAATARLACLQASGALAAQEPMMDRLRVEGMEKLFLEIEMPLVFVLSGMQEEGIYVRADELKSYGESLSGHIAALEEKIYAQAGETFNIQSPKQLGVILFEKMKLPYGKKTKTGYSTAADVLEKLAPEAPVVMDILEYRQLTKLKSTYADGLAAYIGPDGRIHGKFHQTITATGRISSADPNLQNIPVRTELGRELRKVFEAREGYVFVDADYSQIELRVLAHASGDEKLIAAYRQAQDIHAITASQVFHVPLEEVTPELRRNAKAVNFGIVYGISSFGLSQGLSISRKEAQEYIEKYFETYPGIKQFLDGCVAQAKASGYCVTLFGRRRPVPELKSGNFMQRSFGERVAMNAPIQGTAADIMKIAMVRTARRLKSEGLASRIVLQVHDELLVETKLGEEEAVQRILREEMTGAADLRVPLEIDMHAGKNWFEAH